LFAASLSPTVTGLLDTLLTHVSSDGVKLDRCLANLGSIVTLLDRLGEMDFASIRLEAKEF
jgi:hypothetical protein